MFVRIYSSTYLLKYDLGSSGRMSYGRKRKMGMMAAAPQARRQGTGEDGDSDDPAAMGGKGESGSEYDADQDDTQSTEKINEVRTEGQQHDDGVAMEKLG